MSTPPWHRRLERVDEAIAGSMERYGHLLHRHGLGWFFMWMGGLKVAGAETATSILKDVIYLGDPATMVVILGAWEIAIGACFVYRPLVRVALLLLAVRVPGTLLALILLPERCFVSVPLIPTIQGQYLVKDAMLFTAAIVIGGTVRSERHAGVHH